MVVPVSDTATFAGYYSPNTPNAFEIPVDSVYSHPRAYTSSQRFPSHIQPQPVNCRVRVFNIHTSSTPRNLPAFPQAINLTPSIALSLALHEIVVVRSAAGADEEGGGEQGGGGSADFADGGYGIREGGGVY